MKSGTDALSISNRCDVLVELCESTAVDNANVMSKNPNGNCDVHRLLSPIECLFHAHREENCLPSHLLEHCGVTQA